MLVATLETRDRLAELLLLRVQLLDLQRLLLDELLVGRLLREETSKLQAAHFTSLHLHVHVRGVYLLDECRELAHHVRIVLLQIVQLTHDFRLLAVQLDGPAVATKNFLF